MLAPPRHSSRHALVCDGRVASVRKRCQDLTRLGAGCKTLVGAPGSATRYGRWRLRSAPWPASVEQPILRCRLGSSATQKEIRASGLVKRNRPGHPVSLSGARLGFKRSPPATPFGVAAAGSPEGSDVGCNFGAQIRRPAHLRFQSSPCVSVGIAKVSRGPSVLLPALLRAICLRPWRSIILGVCP